MDNIYSILVSSHSGIRWIFLGALFLSVLFAFFKGFFPKAKQKSSRLIYMVTMVFSHVQFILGLILYFTSPKVLFSTTSLKESYYRFFLIEHALLMLISVLLITVGYRKSKAYLSAKNGQRRLFFYYIIALTLVLLAIPWPWQAYGTGWF